MALIAVNYHYVRPDFDYPHPAIYGVTPAQMEAQLAILSRCGTFVSPDEVARATAAEDAALPDNSILVTFDDGLREQTEFALPLLKRMGIPAAFFVNTQPIEQQSVSTVHKIHLLRATTEPSDVLHLLHRYSSELGINLGVHSAPGLAAAQYPFDTPSVAELKYLLNNSLSVDQRTELVDSCFNSVFASAEPVMSRRLYMTKEHLVELSQSRLLGSHGHDHVPLGLLSSTQSAWHVTRSVTLLRDWTGCLPIALSYPYGSREACCATAAATAATCGLAFAFTMERAQNGNADLSRHAFALGRFDCNDLPGGKSPVFDATTLFEEARHRSWDLTTVGSPS